MVPKGAVSARPPRTSSDTGDLMRGPSALSPALRVRRAITLLLMALLVPGSAQLTAGSRWLGRLLLRGWLAVIALTAFAGLIYLLNRAVLFSLLTSTFVLTALALLLFAVAVVWPLTIADAWRLGRPTLLPRRPRLAVSVLAICLMLATSLPLIAGGRRVWAGADLISSVFSAGRVSQAKDGRFNVLLMGGDAGPDRVGTRPDSMTLASIDAQTGRTVLFSLPRNLEEIPFPAGTAAATALPQGWSCGDKCLLNALYTWGTEHKDLYPGVADAGAAVMKQAVSGITGLDVNYYVLIDLSGFRDLIDALGGITVKVRDAVPIGGETSPISGYIQPGTRHLDGYHALWYARSRTGASDYARMARQRCVMDAMVHQLDPTTVLRNFQAIAAAGKNVVSTDIPAGELSTFLDLAARAKSEKISSVQFVPPLITPARPDFELIRSTVASSIEASRHAPASSAAPSPSRSGPGGPSSASSGSSHESPGTSQDSSGPPATASDITATCSAA